MAIGEAESVVAIVGFAASTITENGVEGPLPL
jgi:hypothetical protein